MIGLHLGVIVLVDPTHRPLRPNRIEGPHLEGELNSLPARQGIHVENNAPSRDIDTARGVRLDQGVQAGPQDRETRRDANVGDHHPGVLLGAGIDHPNARIEKLIDLDPLAVVINRDLHVPRKRKLRVWNIEFARHLEAYRAVSRCAQTQRTGARGQREAVQ